MTLLKTQYLQITVDSRGVKTRTCVEKCGQQDTVFLNRCVKNETMESISSLIKKLGLDNFTRKPPGILALLGER